MKRECDLSVTLHINSLDSFSLPKPLIFFNIHDNPYCICIKSSVKAREHCVYCQQAVEKKAQNGDYVGNCYAGVREFVYPVFMGEKQVGFLCVSGYKSDDYESYINKTARKYGLPLEKLNSAYSFLKDKMPEKQWVDTLISPLLSMLELGLMRREDLCENEKFAEKIVNYIKKYHTENIKSEDICRQFSCSRSYLSHEFNSYTGKTIRQYLTELRIEDAKALLKYSKLNITEIAFSVGYSDSNYFSNLFKTITGMSPREYRNKN